MDIVRCQTPSAFLEGAQAFLLRDEACHNLLLGVSATLMGRSTLPDPAPYFALVVETGDIVAAAMITPPHNLVLSRIERQQAVELFARDVRAAGMTPPGVHGPTPVSEQFAEVWQRVTGQRYERGLAQRIYRLERVRAVAGVPGRLRPATEADRPVLISWMRAFLVEAFGEYAPPTDPEQLVDRRLQGPTEGLYMWDDGEPAALAGCTGPTPHGIRIGPVYTPPDRRNRGFASACVAALSQMLLDRGYRFCFLYTDLANPTSNRIYQRIGYEPVCDVAEYRFLSTQRSDPR